MTQKKKLVEKDAGDKDIEFKNAVVEQNKGHLLTVRLKDAYCNFFIKSKDANININFAHGNEIEITTWMDAGKTEIKKLKFESVTKNKILKIKLNKLLDGVEIKNRE